MKPRARARLWCSLAGRGDGGNNLLVPHLISGAPEHTLLMQEEIFGPLLPLVPYPSLG